MSQELPQEWKNFFTIPDEFLQPQVQDEPDFESLTSSEIESLATTDGADVLPASRDATKELREINGAQ